MKYMGSKNRIAKHLLPIILKDRKEGQWYVEPFVGGANMIDKVEGNRIGSDFNKYLIAFLDELSKGEFNYEKFYDRELYNEIRYNKDNYSQSEIGYVGVNCSYCGSWFESYAGISAGRNYQEEAQKNVKKQMLNLKDVVFKSNSYNNLEIPDNSIIYCDPPYAGVREYNSKKGFNHNDFWDWCREKKREGHTIFISEYNAPDDFKCVWEKEVKSSLSANGKSGGNKNSTEKLFTL